MKEDLIEISENQIDILRVYQALSDPRFGAQLVFVGVVRDENEGQRVNAVNYDAFVPLAIKTFEDLASEVRKNAKSSLGLVLLHRLGTLAVGEVSTVIGVSSPHRAESYEASRYLIEQLKVRLPVWKEEHYIDGTKNWLEGTELTATDSSSNTSRGKVLSHGSR